VVRRSHLAVRPFPPASWASIGEPGGP
jgi:hypothetical protein